MRPGSAPRLARHPIIEFAGEGGRATRLHMGLRRPTVVYHRTPAGQHLEATVRALRTSTSFFRFPVVGRLGQMAARRARLQIGLPRARRG